MEVVFKKEFPSIEMDYKLFEKLKKYYSLSASKRICIFGKTKNTGRKTEIVGLHVPEQSASSIYTIVSGRELSELGKKYGCIIRLCNKSDTGIDTSNKTFFSNSTEGLDKYVTIAFYGDSYMADVVDSDIVFHDVKIKFPVNYEKDEREKLRKDFSVVRDHSYKDGYDATVREEYVAPILLVEKANWRDVV